MHKLLRTAFGVLGLSAGLSAQTLVSTQVIHPNHDAPLTAGTVDAAGNLYTASLANVKTTAGSIGIFGVYRVGDPVISKFAPDGSLLWQLEFPDNYARVFDVAVAPDQSIVVAGAYYDTLRSFNMASLPGYDFSTNWWMARIYPDGFVAWLRTDMTDFETDVLPTALEIRGNSIFAAGVAESTSATLREYNLLNGSLLLERVFPGIRTFSDLEIDADGHIFVVGTAAPNSPVDTLVVPVPTTGDLGYANFVMRLDDNFRPLWIRSTSYITFDFNPRLALFDNRVFTVSNDFANNSFNDAATMLRAYSLDGTPQYSEPLTTDATFTDWFNFALTAGCDRLLVIRPVVYGWNDVGLEVRAYDANLDTTVLVASTDADFSPDNEPFLAAGGGHLVYGANVSKHGMTINGAFPLDNPDNATYRQLILHLDCATASAPPAPAPATWQIAPNPVGNELRLTTATPPPARQPARILDAQGRVLHSFVIDGTEVRVPVAQFAPGVYFVEIGGRTIKWVK